MDLVILLLSLISNEFDYLVRYITLVCLVLSNSLGRMYPRSRKERKDKNSICIIEVTFLRMALILMVVK